MIARIIRFTAPTALPIISVTLTTVLAYAIQTYTPINNVFLLYLPAILLCAAILGSVPAVLAAGFSVLEYDYLLLGPAYKFSVPGVDDVLAFVIFGLAAILTSQLAGRARARADAAQRRAVESSMQYELSQALMSVHDVGEVLQAITQRVVDVFSVDRCAIYVPGSGGHLHLAAAVDQINHHADSEEEDALSSVFHEGAFVDLADSGTRRAYVPLRTPESTVGVMEVGLKPSGQPLEPDERRLITSFGAQAALVILRTQLEEERRQLKVLEESDRLKSALLSAVSHDLRTPLASIKASATSLLLSESTWTREEALEFLRTIDEQADHLNRLVGNLLDLSRIEAGVLRPSLDWYDINEVLETVVPRLRALTAGRQLTVHVATPAPLIRLDLVRIEGLVLNLVENAVKYTPTGTPIELRVWTDCEGLYLGVIDHGRGIPTDQRERVFQRFYRLQRHSDRDPGSGLGLAICQGVAEAHGGSIHVEETPGGGATFVLTLPPSLLANAVPA